MMFSYQGRDGLDRGKRQVVTKDRVARAINLARPIVGKRLNGIVRSRSQQNGLRRPHFGGLGEQLQRSRGDLLFDHLGIDPNQIGHLNNLYLSEKVSNLLPAISFVGNDLP